MCQVFSICVVPLLPVFSSHHFSCINNSSLLVFCAASSLKYPDFFFLFDFLLKPKKLTFSNFGNLRKKKQEDGEEYVCPMELGQVSGSASKKGFKPGLDMRLYDEDDLDRLEQVSEP